MDANDKVFKDANGQPTYQNSGCKAYYLPLDNGGYPFEWVSNYQVISAIHLQPHKTKNRTFVLSAKDKKTLAASFNPIKERLKAHRDFDLHATEVVNPYAKKQKKQSKAEAPESPPHDSHSSPSPSPTPEGKSPKTPSPPKQPSSKPKRSKKAAAAPAVSPPRAPASPNFDAQPDFQAFQAELNASDTDTSFFSEAAPGL